MSGKRIKVPVRDAADGEATAQALGFGRRFGAGGSVVNPEGLAKAIGETKVPQEDWSIDDLGLKPVGDAQAAQSASIFPQQTTPTTQAPTPTPSKKRNARSIADTAGVLWASGVVWTGRRICEKNNKTPVNPNPTQVNELRDSIKDTVADWFGDREVAPWQMALILSVVIPASMLIQSKRKEEPQEKKLAS